MTLKRIYVNKNHLVYFGVILRENMEKNSKIFLAGHRGLVGSAILRILENEGYTNVITRTREELNLMDTDAVQAFFSTEKPEYIIDAAAKVGGIVANRDFPAEFIYQNLTIQNNLIEAAHQNGFKKFLFLGSSCIYPKMAKQPIKEEYLMTGPLEPTNAAYATAKIAGIMMCQSYRKQYGDKFISAMPTNLYGPEDNFHPTSSHAIPQIIRKFHEAKLANLESVGGFTDGTPLREFLYVDDLARACIYLIDNYDDPLPINVGTGEDLPMRDVINMTAKIVGYEGEIVLDGTIPNGTPRKVLDISRIRELGWQHSTDLETGLRETYQWFLEQEDIRGY